ncbi:MAG: diguanylate cyclase [gamma proteobacterium symbiont of Taylorina sp.]|nr:diguanylate cyclase [gamma proteobacterium symbiont of Taylorina sp.]
MDLKDCKVLLVDDIKANTALLKKLLKSDYQIDTVNDGKDALHYIESSLPDLVLLDIVMPDIDGYEVCQQLKADERSKDVPIVFITSLNEEGDEYKGLKLGAIDYITKPFNKNIVRARVRNHLITKKQSDLLKNLSNLDGLTSISNRYCFDNYLNNEWQRAMRSDEPLSLILMDIDFFKQYNDHYGHLAGDDCLKQVAQSLDCSIKRSTDFVARYGGEEFVAVLPKTSSDDAIILAEIFRKNIEKLVIKHEFSSTEQHVTISLGVATMIPERNTLPQLLIEAADRNLYKAKESGRNQVKR